VTNGHAQRNASKRPRAGKQRLTRELIIDTALRAIEEVGVRGMTMRSLALRLDADPSAVYRYFRNKDALLSALVDAMLDQFRMPSELADDWRRVVIDSATYARRMLIRAPGLAEVVTSAPITDATIVATTTAVRLLQRGLGVPMERAELAFSMILAHIVGSSLMGSALPVLSPDSAGSHQPLEVALAQRVWCSDDRSREETFVAGVSLIVDSFST
jgi:AcrR family transcriptional regulator